MPDGHRICYNTELPWGMQQRSDRMKEEGSCYVFKERYAILFVVNTYPIGRFAEMVGLSVNTLQRWDREGRLKAARTKRR